MAADPAHIVKLARAGEVSSTTTTLRKAPRRPNCWMRARILALGLEPCCPPACTCHRRLLLAC
ncbi:hypothetical protein HaLaN_02045 [Haematococcus lacustris]|uniref:Uncharacterized protein n=1 Tax=Haematococcus lacustris TaxID=44745 RepID=A0A699YK47_HAELA|nr:hypothetical protein HaLaN_02045 [Haematococcus lacustris]